MPKPKLPPEAMQILQRLSRIAAAHPVDSYIYEVALNASLYVIRGMKSRGGDGTEMLKAQMADWTELSRIADDILQAVSVARNPVALASGGSSLRNAALDIVTWLGEKQDSTEEAL